MANQTDLPALQRERDKFQAALSGVSEKIAAIEDAERREREERERKEREFASLQHKHRACQKWIPWFEGKAAEAKQKAMSQVNAVCEGREEIVLRLNETVLDISICEMGLAMFKELEVSLRANIEALSESK